MKVIIESRDDIIKLLYLLLEIELSRMAVMLKQTYGFPIEITQDLVNEKYEGELKLLPRVIKFYESEHSNRSKSNKFKHGFKTNLNNLKV
jgi:alanyl-tRNA synthetase